MTDAFSPLTIHDYVRQARSTDKKSDSGSVEFPLLGLFGETGSLLSEVKKKQRDTTSYVGYASAVVEELGDVLWYLTIVADRRSVSLVDIATSLKSVQTTDKPNNGGPITFAMLQPEIIPLTKEPTASFEKTLLKLAGLVGTMATEHETNCFLEKDARLVDCITGILRTLVRAANEAGVTLEAAAVKNLAKIFDRWPSERVHPKLPDAEALIEEQFPRDFYVDVFEREVGGKTYVFQRCNNINIGDRLTDNALVEDHYRFHDVFHYAYVAVLGWSPVVRSLFRLKRKSNAAVDEVEDGARAALIEEGVTTWIFGQAANMDFFANLKPGELPFDLLKHIRQFVSGYEAEHFPLWLWEDAILDGYAVFRYLREHRRGRLHIDMISRRLTVEALP